MPQPSRLHTSVPTGHQFSLENPSGGTDGGRGAPLEQNQEKASKTRQAGGKPAPPKHAVVALAPAGLKLSVTL